MAEKKEVLVIKAGAVLTPLQRREDAYLLIEGGTLRRIGSLSSLKEPVNAAIVDAADQIVAPGYIDIHIHGNAGVDVMDCSFEEFDRITLALARRGTTSFLPTTMTAPLAWTAKALDRLGHYLSRPVSGAFPLGIHMEGPFINPAMCGTHPTEHILPPSLELLRQWQTLSSGQLRMMTIAPELPGALESIRTAASMKVVPAIGHSDATEPQCLEAIGSGARHAIHVFNAMRPFRHRDPGIVGCAAADDRLSGEVIADGVHVHPSAVRILWRAKPADRFILVTDATSATGMPDGQYTIGDKTIFVKDGVCRDGRGALAGSTLTLDRAITHLRDWTGCTWEQAVAAATRNPALLLGIADRRGVLRPGAAADLVFLSETGEVQRTMIAGRFIRD